MYRFSAFAPLHGLGAEGCASPSECDQALRRYPAFVDSMRVLSYCDDSPSEQAKTEIMCLQALADGEKAEKTGPVGPSFPWQQFSVDTESLQATINQALTEKGYCPIGIDGKLGPATCGASRTVIGSAPGTCEDFADPKKAPCGASKTTTTFASIGGDNAPLWLIVGSLAAVAVAGAALWVRS
jgi:hypothetical protein